MNKEKIEEKYLTNQQSYINAINAWKNVKRVTKKDGGDFANIGKNFLNATVRQRYIWNKTLELTVDYCCGNSYTYDSVEIKNDDSIEDVFEKINKRIILLTQYVEEEEKKINNFKNVFNEVDKTMKELLKFCKENNFSAYEICDYIRNNYWNFEQYNGV